jgi:hypothetical protein
MVSRAQKSLAKFHAVLQQTEIGTSNLKTYHNILLSVYEPLSISEHGALYFVIKRYQIVNQSGNVPTFLSDILQELIDHQMQATARLGAYKDKMSKEEKRAPAHRHMD